MASPIIVYTAPPASPEYCFLWADRWFPLADPWWLCMQKAEWSGWAQAVGVLVTVFAGFVYIALQARHGLRAEAERQRLERRRVLHVVYVALSDALAVTAMAEIAYAEETPDADTIVEEAKRAHATLDAIPLVPMGETALIHYVSIGKIALRGIIGSIRNLQQVRLTDERRTNTLRYIKLKQNLIEELVRRVGLLIHECSTAEELARDDAVEAITPEPFVWQEIESAKD